MKTFKSFINEVASSIHRIHNGDLVRGTYMNVPYTGFVATQRVHPTNHDIRIFTVKLDAPIVVHGMRMTFLTVNASDNPALASDRIALRESYDDIVANAENTRTLTKLQHICQEINFGKGHRPGRNLKLEVLPVSQHRHLSSSALNRLQKDDVRFLLVTVLPGQRPEQGDVVFVIRGMDNQQIVNAHAYFSGHHTYQDVCGTVSRPDYSAMTSAAGL